MFGAAAAVLLLILVVVLPLQRSGRRRPATR